MTKKLDTTEIWLEAYGTRVRVTVWGTIFVKPWNEEVAGAVARLMDVVRWDATYVSDTSVGVDSGDGFQVSPTGSLDDPAEGFCHWTWTQCGMPMAAWREGYDRARVLERL